MTFDTIVSYFGDHCVHRSSAEHEMTPNRLKNTVCVVIRNSYDGIGRIAIMALKVLEGYSRVVQLTSFVRVHSSKVEDRALELIYPIFQSHKLSNPGL
jgi:hypothetical protein